MREPLICVICGEKHFLIADAELPVECVADVTVGYKCPRCLDEELAALRIIYEELDRT